MARFQSFRLGGIAPRFQAEHSLQTSDAKKITYLCSVSSPALHEMATAATATPPASLHRTQSEGMDVQDARIPSPASSEVSRYGSEASRHEDEMATLNSKLVAAINHQTSLDDSLQAARKELEEARQKIEQLQEAAKKHEELISNGLLVKKEDVEKKQSAWEKELADEKKLRAKAEKERKGMEQELENLTSQLFEEANQMVAAARKEAEAAERKTDQYKNQLSDNEALLQSQQEQLQDLKIVLEKVTSEKDEESTARSATEPSTPGVAPVDKMSRMFESMNLTPVSPGEDIQPEHPLKFTHLIHPVLRSDLHAYRDFSELIKSAWASKPPSRVSSGSFGSLNVLNAANGSQPSPTGNSPNPNTGSFAHVNGSGSSSPRESTVAPLKDTKVYKRAAAEDIEPTMRLDIAPGVSWLARRTILNSMAAGTFSIEPMPPPNRFRGPVYPCALCGENRKGDLYSRKHRFRTAETEDAVRYPLCDPCLGRVRSSCDYISFLRMIRDGHWKADTDEDVKAAWEESVRLRERMFWQRIGGGVVPAFLRTNGDSTPRSPTFSSKDRKSADTNGSRGEEKKDPFHDEKGEKRVSIGDKIISKKEKQSSSSEDEASQQLRNEMRKSLNSRSSGSDTVTDQLKVNGTESPEATFATPATSPGVEVKKNLEIEIPGSRNG